VGGTTALVEKPMIEPKEWLEIGPMDVDDDEYETINIRAMDIAKMDPAQKELFE